MKLNVSVKDFLAEMEKKQEREATHKRHVKDGLIRRESLPPPPPKRGFDGR